MDTNFHEYFDKQKITSIEEHLSLEFFYDVKHKNNTLPIIVVPKELLEKTIKKHYSTEKIKLNTNSIELLSYSLYLKTIQEQIIDNKHVKPKFSLVDTFLL